MGPLDVHLADDSQKSLLREGILDVGEEFILQISLVIIEDSYLIATMIDLECTK